jgi:hypothetical protein
MAQQVPPGWRPQGPYQGPHAHPMHAQQGYRPNPPPKKSNQTLFVVLGVLGAFFFLSTCGVLSAVIMASSGSEPTTTPTALPAAPSPAPAPERESDTRSRSGGSLDTTECRTKSGYVIATSKEKLETVV